MQNIILKGMFEEFISRFSIEGDSRDVAFEKFVNYCVLASDHYDSFDFDRVSVGDAQGVDGVAVAISDVIVSELDDARHLTKGSFSAHFHFTQAKTSPGFDLGDFLKFASMVRTFFGDNKSALPVQLHSAFEVKKLIYERAARLKEFPTLSMTYAYTGDFKVDSPETLGAIDAEIEALRNKVYGFSSVHCQIADGQALISMYREAQNDTKGSVPFQRHTALPAISRATAAYIGVMKCVDYVRLIAKSNGEINKGLFYDNVRDFLGASSGVNRSIVETISSSAEKDQFALLNNGVTIVARRVVPSGDRFELHKFQVVNGCQTSHVLFENKDKLTEDMFVSVKLIETTDVDLASNIIRSTNSQSEVKKEAFATIRPYHRVLEDFFSAMRLSGYEYYYERRPHQYDGIVGVASSRVVSAPSLIKSFVSVVLGEPHKVHYYYGRLLDEYNQDSGSELFSEDDYPGLYFASWLIASKARELFWKTDLKDWVFHIAYLVRVKLAPELQRRGAFADRRYMDVLRRIDEGFAPAAAAAARVVRQQRLAANQNRLPNITELLVSEFQKQAGKGPALPAQVRVDGPSDGHFIGRIERYANGANVVQIKYGSQVFDAEVPPAKVPLDVRVGDRVSFNRSQGRVVVENVLP